MPRAHLILVLAASWARSLVRFFVGLGVFGPFLLETLDSSFFYAPLANELLLFALIHGDSPNWMWPLYAVSGAAGSLAGVFLLDLVVRRVGEEGIERLVRRRHFERIKARMKGHTGWVIFLAGTLPPPFPFRITVMTASALQSPRGVMLSAVFFGRLVRFGAEALLILYFGRQFIRFMQSEAFEYLVYGLTLVAVVGSLFTVFKLFGGGGARPAPRGSR